MGKVLMVGVILLIIVGVFWSSSITGNSIWDRIFGKKSYSPPSKSVTSPSAKGSSSALVSNPITFLQKANTNSGTTSSFANFYTLTSSQGSPNSQFQAFKTTILAKKG